MTNPGLPDSIYNLCRKITEHLTYAETRPERDGSHGYHRRRIDGWEKIVQAAGRLAPQVIDAGQDALPLLTIRDYLKSRDEAELMVAWPRLHEALKMTAEALRRNGKRNGRPAAEAPPKGTAGRRKVNEKVVAYAIEMRKRKPQATWKEVLGAARAEPSLQGEHIPPTHDALRKAVESASSA